jgi:hypothetical protein
MRRELPCSIYTPANQTSRIEHGIRASKPPPNKLKKKVLLSGLVNNMQLGMSA